MYKSAKNSTKTKEEYTNCLEKTGRNFTRSTETEIERETEEQKKEYEPAKATN